MGTISALNLARLRETTHASQLFMAVYRPAIALSGVTGQNNPPGDISIGLTGVVQTRPVYRDYLVNISHIAAGDDDLGFSRLRQYTSSGGGNGTLEIAPGNADSGTGDYYSVLEYIPPVSIRPRQQASGILEDWNVAYTDENLLYRPRVHIGPPASAWRDPVTGLASVYFHDSSVAFGSATISGYNWYLPGSDDEVRTDNDFMATWDTAGQYYINAEVTDSEGQTHRGFRPVFIFDPPDTGGVQPITQFAVSNLEGSRDRGGWSCAVTIYGEAALDDYPHAAQVVLFTRDWYGTEEISIGGNYPGRSNIAFVGWIRGASLRRDRRKRTVEFQLDGIGPLMDNINMAACNLKANPTPTGWHELSGMTCNKVAYHLLTEHSTITHIADVHFNGTANWRPVCDLTAASLLEQLSDQNYSGDRVLVMSDAQSALWCVQYPPWAAQADRPSDVIAEITTADALTGEIDFGGVPQEMECGRLAFTGIYWTSYGNYRTYGAYAPLNITGTGQLESVDGILVASQAEANQFAGLFYAWMNAGYKDIILQLKGNWPFFDLAPFARVLLTVTADEHPRGTAWAQQACWLTRVSRDYHPGAGFLTTIGLERNTGAMRGWKKTMEVPDVDPPDGVTIPPPPAVSYVPPLSIAPGGMYAVSSYDLTGGQYEAFTAGFTEQMSVLVACEYSLVALHAVGNLTWQFYANGAERLRAVRSGGDWTLTIYDYTEALVETQAGGSADDLLLTFVNTVSLVRGSRVRATVTPDGEVSDYTWGVGVR